MNSSPSKPTVLRSLEDITLPPLPGPPGQSVETHNPISIDLHTSNQQSLERSNPLHTAQVHNKNELQAPHDEFEQLRKACESEQYRLKAIKAEADRIASNLPEARLTEFQMRETLLAQKEALIEKNLSATALLEKSANVEASSLLAKARTEAERIKELTLNECNAKTLALNVREKELTRLDTDSLKAEIVVLRRKNGRLSRRIKEKHREMASLEIERDRAQSELKKAHSLNTVLHRKKLRDENEIAAATGQIFAHCPLVISWLAERDDPENNLNWSKHIVTIGSDPVNVDFLDNLLRREGHVVYEYGDPKADAMIVGRNGWTPDELQEQIDAREGDTLRIYSQEMALIAILTGNDPFDADDDTIKEMGSGHPALEYLMTAPFEWPSCGTIKGAEIQIDADSWRPDSPLTTMGYHVGKSSKLTLSQRKEILTNIFKGRLKFPADFGNHEKNDWGSPASRTRLEKIARHITNSLEFSIPNKARDYSTAVNHWKKDLAWLKKAYYRPSYKFHWPKINV